MQRDLLINWTFATVLHDPWFSYRCGSELHHFKRRKINISLHAGSWRLSSACKSHFIFLWQRNACIFSHNAVWKLQVSFQLVTVDWQGFYCYRSALGGYPMPALTRLAMHRAATIVRTSPIRHSLATFHLVSEFQKASGWQYFAVWR